MAERVNHPPHYNAGGIECIDALEAATSGLQGIEAFCTANAIKYLWRWKLKNGEEDLQKAVWYINRLIQRAGAGKRRKGAIQYEREQTRLRAETGIHDGRDHLDGHSDGRGLGEVHCFRLRRGTRAFDEGNKNGFAASSLRAYLNGEFLRRLIKAGAPEEMFEYFNIDLTADDGEEATAAIASGSGLSLARNTAFCAATFQRFRIVGGDSYTGQPDKFFRPRRQFGRLFGQQLRVRRRQGRSPALQSQI